MMVKQLVAFVLLMDNTKGDGDVPYDTLGVVLAPDIHAALPALQVMVNAHTQDRTEPLEPELFPDAAEGNEQAEWVEEAEPDDRYGDVVYKAIIHTPVVA